MSAPPNGNSNGLNSNSSSSSSSGPSRGAASSVRGSRGRGAPVMVARPIVRPKATPSQSSSNLNPSSTSNATTPSTSSRGGSVVRRGGVVVRGASTKPVFRPVVPVRRRGSATPATTTLAESSSSPSQSPASSRGNSRGRGGRGGGVRPRFEPQAMVASGPFSMGSGAIRAARSKSGGGGGGMSFSSTPTSYSASEGLQPGMSRSYRNPDEKLEKEDYSDNEEVSGGKPVDMEEVETLDGWAPTSLGRYKEKDKKVKKESGRDGKEKKKKKKQTNKEGEDENIDGIKIKPEPDEDGDILISNGTSGGIAEQDSSRAQTVTSGTSTPKISDSDEEDSRSSDDEPNADALDLSESEEEEMLDDLVDDLYQMNSFGDDEEDSPEGKIYLFQFPALFPTFEPSPIELKKKEGSESGGSGSGRRSVAFAEGTTGGEKDLQDEEEEKKKIKQEIKPDVSGDDSLAAAAASLRKEGEGSVGEAWKEKVRSMPEGRIGNLEIGKDRKVRLRCGEVLMELTGGTQSTFLESLMLMEDPQSNNRKPGKALHLGDIARKFVLSPDLDSVLDDGMKMDEEMEQLRLDEERIKKEKERQAQVAARSSVSMAPPPPPKASGSRAKK